jgi:ABC-type transport system substrate-binding protein
MPPAFEPLSLSAPNCDYGGFFQTIEALDEFTVRFTLCMPDPAFLSKMAFSVFSIYPQEWLEATTEPGARLEAPVGTGAYVLSDWTRGESITFTRFEDYWGEPAIPDTVVFRWSTESAARLLELQAGTVDGIDNPGPDDFEVIRGDPSLQLLERPALNVFYLAMTNTFEPFDDVRVRQAVAMGIDRQRIVSTFYPPGSEVASHFTPCAIPNGCTGDPWYDFDPEAARALLADAGFPDGFSTGLFYRDVVRGYLPEVGRVAEEIQAQLKENLNIDAEIVVMESGAFIEESTAGRLDGFYMLGWGADYPHVTNFLDFHFSADNPQFGNQFPEYYEKLEQGAQIADPAEAAPIYVEANNAIRELVPMVPIAHGGSGVAYKADVEGGHASPLSNEYFAVVDPGGRDTFVWMQNAEPISLFCADETDGESLRACEQIMEPLYTYEVGGTAVKPALATSCEPNEDLTVWTCTLLQGVKFHDGSDFDANDVVATFTMGLDASSPLHVGNTNAWEYYSYLWGLMNVEE